MHEVGSTPEWMRIERLHLLAVQNDLQEEPRFRLRTLRKKLVTTGNDEGPFLNLTSDSRRLSTFTASDYLFKEPPEAGAPHGGN